MVGDVIAPDVIMRATLCEARDSVNDVVSIQSERRDEVYLALVACA
jgi:hypothetical protein